MPQNTKTTMSSRKKARTTQLSRTLRKLDSMSWSYPKQGLPIARGPKRSNCADSAAQSGVCLIDGTE